MGICAYNEEKNIGNLLSFLQNTNLKNSKISEIIVVASGCEDGTCEIVKKFRQKDKRIRLIVEDERRGKASAFNEILQTYKGDILINIDADCCLESDSLKFLLEYFNDNKVGAVTGCRIPVGNSTLVEKVSKVIWEVHNEAQQHFTIKKNFAHIDGGFFAVRSGICDSIPEDIINDDGYIEAQCKIKGLKVLFEKRAKLYFKVPSVASELINQRRRIIYGHFKVKKVSGVTPSVLEMSPFKDQIAIISNFLRQKWHCAPYFLMACFLEVYVNLLAKLDMLKKYNPHVVWKVAKTTKKLS